MNITAGDGPGSPTAKRIQQRAVATRRLILDAAIDLFRENGYPGTGTRQIIAASGMTGGAFYHHFDDKDAVAKAILTEANAKVYSAYQGADTGGQAFEAVIRGTFAVAILHVTDPGVRISSQLMHTVGTLTGKSARNVGAWVDAIADQIARGQAQGDVRADVDPKVIGHSVVCASYGAWAVASLYLDQSSVIAQLNDVWEALLPGLLVADAIPYFRELLNRQAQQSLTFVRDAIR